MYVCMYVSKDLVKYVYVYVYVYWLNLHFIQI